MVPFKNPPILLASPIPSFVSRGSLPYDRLLMSAPKLYVFDVSTVTVEPR